MSEKKTIVLEDLNADEASNLLGTQDRNLNVLAQSFGYTIYYRDNVFTIEDCPDEVAQKIEEVLHALLKQAERGISITEQDVIYASRAVQHNEPVDFEEFSKKIVGRLASGKAIMPKTRGQLAFVNAMEEKAIVFAVGPAGTGKTFLAVTAAVSALKRGDVKRIVLTRPAVEAGESLGFLPGDLKEKVDPYLTPLYDALHDLLGSEQTEKLIEKGTIEIPIFESPTRRTRNKRTKNFFRGLLPKYLNDSHIFSGKTRQLGNRFRYSPDRLNANTSISYFDVSINDNKECRDTIVPPMEKEGMIIRIFLCCIKDIMIIPPLFSPK